MIRTVLLALVFGATLIGTANAQSDLVKRGDYLVNGVLTCGNCHRRKARPATSWRRRSPADCGTSRRLTSQPNITPDKETGIGTWTDAQIKRDAHRYQAERHAAR